MGRIEDLYNKELEQGALVPLNQPDEPEDMDCNTKEDTPMSESRPDPIETAITEACRFYNGIIMEDFSKFTKGNVAKILNENNRHIRALVDAAPLFHEGRNLTEDNNIFTFFQLAGNSLSNLFGLPLLIAGHSRNHGAINRASLDLVKQIWSEHKTWSEVKPILAEITEVPKAGGGTWELTNWVTLLDISQRNRAFGTAIGDKKRQLEDKAKAMRAQKDELLKQESLLKLAFKRIKKTHRSNKTLTGKVNMALKRWLADV